MHLTLEVSQNKLKSIHLQSSISKIRKVYLGKLWKKGYFCNFVLSAPLHAEVWPPWYCPAWQILLRTQSPIFGMDELHYPPGKSWPCWHFILNPRWPFTIAGATFQPQTLFSISGKAKAASPGRKFMEISPRFFSENGGQSHGKAKYQCSLSGHDRWDIIIYCEYFNVWNQSTALSPIQVVTGGSSKVGLIKHKLNLIWGIEGIPRSG